MKKRKDEFDWQILYEEATIPSIFEEGFEKGREEGREEYAKEIVLKLLAKFPDFSDSLTADISGVPLDFIRHCRKELKNGKEKK